MRNKLIIFLLGLIGVMALAAFLEPVYCEPSTSSVRNACIANLKQIDGAKATWALENHVTNDVEVTAAVIYGQTNYIRDAPDCPKGGLYRIGKVSEKPRCSVPGHTL